MSHGSDELEVRLERALSAGAAAPPGAFLSSVRGRRRRIVLARAGAGGVIAMLVVAAVWMAGVMTPAPAKGPIARDPGRGLTGVDGGGLGAGSARAAFNGPGPAAAEPVRMGDRPDSARVRALLEA